MSPKRLLFALLLSAPGYASAADNTASAMRERLGFFVARWSVLNEIMPSPSGGGTTYPGWVECRWFDSHAAIVCEGKDTIDGNETASLSIVGYSPAEKRYTYYNVSSDGPMTVVPQGTINHDTWTYNYDDRVSKRSVKTRVRIVEASTTSYVLTVEILNSAKHWALAERSVFTKIP